MVLRAATWGCSFHKRPINTQEVILRYLRTPLFTPLSFFIFSFSRLPGFLHPSPFSPVRFDPPYINPFLLRRPHLSHSSSSVILTPFHSFHSDSSCFLRSCNIFRADEPSAIEEVREGGKENSRDRLRRDASGRHCDSGLTAPLRRRLVTSSGLRGVIRLSMNVRRLRRVSVLQPAQPAGEHTLRRASLTRRPCSRVPYVLILSPHLPDRRSSAKVCK